MAKVSKVILPRTFWISSILTLAWGSLPSGIYILVAGRSQKWGAPLLVLGVILLAVLVLPGVLGRLERRAVLVPQGVLAVVSLAILALLRLWMAVTGLSRNDWRDAFALIDAVGFVALAGLTAFLFVRALRTEQDRRAQPPSMPRGR